MGRIRCAVATPGIGAPDKRGGSAMEPARAVRLLAVTAAAVIVGAGLSGPSQAAPAKDSGPGRYLVVARTDADYAGLRDSATHSGAKVVRELLLVNDTATT